MSETEKEWKLSEFTSLIADRETGGLLLHNSFMGALARIPPDKLPSLMSFLGNAPGLSHGPSQYRYDPAGSGRRNPRERDLENPALRELCEGGFFVPADLDERNIVSEIIEREREANFGMIILPHENCNFRCVYCYEKFERGKIKPHVVAGLKRFAREKAKSVRYLSVSWFGGEPLLAHDAICDLADDFMNTCAKENVFYSSSITTNGHFLTPDLVSSLLARRVTHFQVTLDGPESLHNSNRKLAGGGGTYNTIKNNLIQMHQRQESFSVKVRVNFDSKILSVGESFLNEMAECFDADSRFALDFHPIGKWGGPNDHALDVCNAESAEQVKLELLRRALPFNLSQKTLKENLAPHSHICYAGKESSIVVGSDGMVYKCTVVFDDPRNQVGVLREDGTLVVNPARWNLWTKLEGKRTDKCSSCSFSPSCQSRSCPLVTIEQAEPRCPLGNAEYETLVQLAASTFGSFEHKHVACGIES